MIKQLVKIFLFLIISHISFADDDINQKGALLNISATESLDVEQDLLKANLRIEIENNNPRDLQNEVNKLMKKAIEKTKGFKNIDVSTGQYSVYKYYPPEKKNNNKEYIWRGSQYISLSSKSSDDILKLIGELQNNGLIINDINYVVSEKKAEETRDFLMEKSIEKLINKANRVAKALNKDTIKIVTINVDSNVYIPSPVAQFARMKTEMSSPVAVSGQTQITMTVSATISIQD